MKLLFYVSCCFHHSHRMNILQSSGHCNKLSLNLAMSLSTYHHISLIIQIISCKVRVYTKCVTISCSKSAFSVFCMGLGIVPTYMKYLHTWYLFVPHWLRIYDTFSNEQYKKVFLALLFMFILGTELKKKKKIQKKSIF